MAWVAFTDQEVSGLSLGKTGTNQGLHHTMYSCQELISHSKTSSSQNACHTHGQGWIWSIPWSPEGLKRGEPAGLAVEYHIYLICRQIQKLPVSCFQPYKYACHSSYLPSLFPFLLGYAIDHIPHQSLVPKGFATGKISGVSMLPPRRHEFPWPQYSQSVVCCWNELPAKGQQKGVCDGKCTEDMGDHGRVQSLLGC